MDMHYQLLCNWNLYFRKSSDRASLLFISQGGSLVYFINTVFLHGKKRGVSVCWVPNTLYNSSAKISKHNLY